MYWSIHACDNLQKQIVILTCFPKPILWHFFWGKSEQLTWFKFSNFSAQKTRISTWLLESNDLTGQLWYSPTSCCTRGRDQHGGYEVDTIFMNTAEDPWKTLGSKAPFTYYWQGLGKCSLGVVTWAPQISWRGRLLNYQCWKGTCGLLMSVLGNFRWPWCNTILKEIQNKVVMSGEEHWGTDVIHGSFSLTREGLYCRIDLFRRVFVDKRIDPEMCAAKD